MRAATWAACAPKAVPQPDGSVRLEGSKIFISGGEHDLTDNIVHLVLCRLPDAPPGPKGLSLVLAPKVLDDGTRNAVHCERIEEKMGLHGSPTCVMRFDGATGWLVGEPGQGLQDVGHRVLVYTDLVALEPNPEFFTLGRAHRDGPTVPTAAT